MIDIFGYTDYRRLLGDLYKYRKKCTPRFSYRYISRMLGVKSPAVYRHIVTGKLKISEPMLSKLAGLYGFDALQAAYLASLVRYGQAETAGERDYYEEEIVRIRSLNARKIPPEQFEFYTQWYYTAVWAAIRCRPFRGNYRELARSLEPSISVSQARKAVKLLVKLGFVKRRPDGVYEQTSRMITTGEGVASVAVSVFHRQTLELALRAIDGIARPRRQVSTVTLGVSKRDVELVKKELARCRRRLMSIGQNSRRPNRVYQLNFQMFPLLKWEDGKS